MQARLVLVLGLSLLAAATGCSDSNLASGSESCQNGEDDDGDGLVDCEDPDCAKCAGDGGVDTVHVDGGALPSAIQTVLNSLTMPRSAAEYAVDLDNDGTKDNRVGLILAALLAANPKLDLQQDLDRQLAQGKLLSLYEVFAASLTDASSALLQVYLGQDLDGDPTNNTSGSATLGVLDTGTSLPGKIVGGQLQLGPGSLTTPVAIGTTYVTITLKAAVMRAKISKAGMAEGMIAGAVPMTEVSTKLVPALAKEINRQYHDPKSTATGKKLLREVFDLDKDGAISAQELKNNPFITTALNSPDVDSDGDGQKDAMSVGFGFTAVPCTIKKQ